MADVEVLVLSAGAVGHGTSNLVRPVPNKLCRNKSTGRDLHSAFYKQAGQLIGVPKTNLCEVSHHSSIDGSHSVAPVLDLVVPGLNGVTPGVLVAGHVQILPTSTGCSEEGGARDASVTVNTS